MPSDSDNIIETMDKLEISTEETSNNFSAWKTHIDDAGNSLSNISENIEKVNAKFGGSFQTGSTKREIDSVAKEVKKLRDEIIKTQNTKIDGKKTIGSLSEEFNKISSLNPQNFKEKMGGLSTSLAGVKNDMLKMFGQMEVDADTTAGKAAISLASIGMSLGNVKMFKILGDELGYNTLQKHLKDMEKSALSLGMTFGKSFKDAMGDVGEFENSMLKTQSTLYVTEEEVNKVRNALGEAFSASQMSTTMLDLQDAFNGVSSAANMTNAVILTSKATGMDEASVAKMMAEAHLELGLSAEKAAMSMGVMREANKGSGLTFGKVSGSIMESAKLLKYYGGTVESVTPLFKRFNESMKGIGREGLTPELLKDFTSGLATMTLSTRSLLSLSAPGMATGAGGMLGGGLAMEKAMEEGDMETVAKSITETIKKYSGGGPILTREQALENPAMTRAYIIQRQMLGQLTKISDPGKQNMMLEVLKNVDKNGLDYSSDMKKSFSELMESGEKTAKETTTDLERAEAQHRVNVISRADTLINIAKGILEKSGASGVARGVSRALEASAGLGVPNLQTMKGSFMGARISDDEMRGLEEKVAKGEGGEGDRVKLGEARALNTAESAADIYKKAIAEAFQDPKNIGALRRYQTTGLIDKDIQKSAYDASTGDLKDRIKELQNIRKKDRTAEQTTELTNLKLADQFFNRGEIEERKKYTGPEEGRAEWEKERAEQRKRSLNLEPALEAAQLKREQDLAKMSPEDRIRAKLGTIDAGQKAPLPQQLAPIPGIERGRTRIGVDQDELASITLSPEELRKRQVKEQFGKVVASSTASFAGPSLKDTMNAENITRVTRQEQMKQGSTEKQEPRDIKVNSEVVVRFEGLESVRADVKTIAKEVGRDGAKEEIATQTRTP